MDLKIHKKNFRKISKILFSRVGSMVIFSAITSVIIFLVTMNDSLDELTNSVTTAQVAKISSNILDDQSSLSPVITPVVEKVVVTDMQPIPFDVQQEYSPFLDEGQTVVYPGRPGQMVTQYEHVMVNGKLMNVHTLSNNAINPQPQKILIGIRKPLRLLNSNNQINLDENGCPTEFETFLPDKVATAYTANRGARTSTNKVPQVGFVAVNPKVIPYHSLLYIKSHDSDFAGIFVAEDTGGAMRQGKADIDVYMTCEKQCWLFGRQSIDIWVLE